MNFDWSVTENLFIWPTFHFLTLQRNLFMFLHVI